MNEATVYTQRVRKIGSAQIKKDTFGTYLEVMAYTPETLRNNLYDLRNQVDAAIKECERDMGWQR